MNENLDLTKILEGCPKGTEFYHAGYGRVWFVGISIDSNYANYPDYPILLSLCNDPYYPNIPLTKKGTISARYEGECLLFPSKGQRDWSKFERFWDKPKKDKFNVNTLQGNNMNNIEKLKRISTPAEENWFKIAEEWEREDKEEE